MNFVLKTKTRLLLSALAIMLAVISLSLITIGCKSSGVKVIPEGCENSLIYQKIDHPTMVKASLFLANAAALKKGLYSTDQVLSVLNELEGLLTPESLTYQVLVTAMIPIINKLNENAGFIVLGLSPGITQLQEDIPIDDCDREIILGLIQEIKITVAALAIASE